jgi:DNA-binding transcriptional LysR family regulator
MADLTELTYFVAVARSGSFAAAARRLAISPAMVGRRIQALEERYDMTLIERTTRTQRLTTAGLAFLKKSSEILDSIEELDELARPDATALSGRIRMAGPTTLGAKRLARIVSEMSAEHPELALELHLSDRTVDLVAEGFDLAVRIGKLPSSSMVARRAGHYDFVCCASKDFVKREGAPENPKALSESRCIYNLNLAPRNQWHFRDKNDKAVVVQVHASLEIDHGEALRSAALAGAGIIYAPRCLVEEDLRASTLVQVMKGFRTVSLPIHVLQSSHRFVPRRVKALAKRIAASLQSREL